MGNEEKIKIVKKIIKECFWGDYNICTDDILYIINNGSKREKLFLFNKIIRNSRKATLLLKVFQQEELSDFLTSFRISNFNKSYLEKKIFALQKNLLDIDTQIKGLEWI